PGGRAVAGLGAEVRAMGEAAAAGKELPAEGGLEAGSTRNGLSAKDLGKIAELKTLLRQLAEAENPVGGEVDAVKVAGLSTEIDAHLAALGLDGVGAAERRAAILEPRLGQAERNGLAARNDRARRDALAQAEPQGHA